MKLKLSILTILLFFLSASFPLAAQKAPQTFDIDTPSLRVFLPAPELATGRAIVACPGGGYGGLAVNHEGYDWAPYFNKQGIALIVLKYRMPHGDRTLPISDAEAAMKMARDSADVWNLNIERERISLFRNQSEAQAFVTEVLLLADEAIVGLLRFFYLHVAMAPVDIKSDGVFVLAGHLDEIIDVLSQIDNLGRFIYLGIIIFQRFYPHFSWHWVIFPFVSVPHWFRLPCKGKPSIPLGCIKE